MYVYIFKKHVTHYTTTFTYRIFNMSYETLKISVYKRSSLHNPKTVFSIVVES